MELRRVEESIFKALMMISLIIVVGSLLGVIGIILWNGLPALNIDMLTKTVPQNLKRYHTHLEQQDLKPH